MARVIDRVGAPLSKFNIDDTKLTTMMPYGAMLKIPDAATANEDAKDGHQQQQPLWVYAPFGAPAAPAVPCKKAFRSRLTEGWAKGREQSRQNRQQNGRTSAVSCLTFKSALGGGACGPLWPLSTSKELCSIRNKYARYRFRWCRCWKRG